MLFMKLQYHTTTSEQWEDSRSYISFSNCFLINSLECAVTLSALLHSINIGILRFTMIAFVSISYKYLADRANIQKIIIIVIHK